MDTAVDSLSHAYDEQLQRVFFCGLFHQRARETRALQRHLSRRRATTPTSRSFKNIVIINILQDIKHSAQYFNALDVLHIRCETYLGFLKRAFGVNVLFYLNIC